MCLPGVRAHSSRLVSGVHNLAHDAAPLTGDRTSHQAVVLCLACAPCMTVTNSQGPLSSRRVAGQHLPMLLLHQALQLSQGGIR